MKGKQRTTIKNGRTNLNLAIEISKNQMKGQKLCNANKLAL